MINKIMTTAIAFRNAIEASIENGEFANDIFLSCFPNGCCGECSDLLAHHLLLQGINSKYVCGSYYYDDPEIGPQSHAWLDIDGLIVDITGDQFKNKKEFMYYDTPVYVGEMDGFHKLFEVDEVRDVRDSVLLSDLDGPCIADSLWRYDTILMYMK